MFGRRFRNLSISVTVITVFPAVPKGVSCRPVARQEEADVGIGCAYDPWSFYGHRPVDL